MPRPLPFLLALGFPLATFAPAVATAGVPAFPVALRLPASGPDDDTAPKGRLSGVVRDEQGQPVAGVSVALKGTYWGTDTDAAGRFRLTAPEGDYQLVISGIGYATREQAVHVAPGETLTLPAFTLATGNQQLQEVTVTGRKTLNERPVAIGKMPVASLDLPQSAVTVEREVLEQQQVLRLSDALANVAGLYVTSTTGGTQEELGSRGFAYGSNNTFKNGVRFNNGVMPETSSLERMEVLKGSAAILYGNVAAGGVLNLVTKKPRFERGGAVGLRVGSFGFWKPTFDVYGGVGKSENVAFRLNGTYEQGNSYRDEVKSDRVYVNPSLLFKLTPNTTFVLEGDYLRDNRTPDYGIGAIDYRILESRNRFLNVDGALNATQQTSATATLTSRLSDTWQLRAVGGFQRYDNEQRSASRPIGINNGTRLASGTAGRPGYVAAAPKPSLYGDWQRSLQRNTRAENYYLAQLDLTGQFRTGFLGHTLLIGADADQYQTNALAYGTVAFDSINVLNPARTLGQPRTRVNGFGELTQATRTLGSTRRAGFYVQDLISITEQVKLLAGVRWSYQETPSDVYTYSAPNATTGLQTATVAENRRYDNAFSPRLGLVYQPVKTTAVFVSHSNSFTPNAGISADGAALAPSILKQYEAGIKNDLFNGALSANVTAYRIVNSDQSQTIQQFISGTLTPNPAFNPNQPTAQELAGEVTSKGVELDVQSKPMQGWSVLAGYSYNHTAYTKSNLYEVGSRLRYNPAHTANASLFYTFGHSFGNNPVLRGFTAGVTGYYVGDRLAGRNTRLVNANTGQPITDTFQLISIPNYVLLDASLGYSYERFTVRVKLANLLNELSYNLHDDNSVNPIAPRTFSASVGYRL